MLTRMLARLAAVSPGLRRTLWRNWYQLLARRYPQGDWLFMNYGYADCEAGARELALEEADEPDRYFIQLYHQVASAVDLRGKRILEVGSGRGGGCSYIARCMQPQFILGVDFSGQSVALCKQRHSLPNLSFLQGDAESLPLEDHAFDVVLNVESSHCYRSMGEFLSEVVRVLKPGGNLLWADLRAREQIETTRLQFRNAGLDLLQERRITPNVARALDLMSEWKKQAIQSQVPSWLRGPVEDFAGVRGTRVYEALRSGEVEYLSCVLRKAPERGSGRADG